MKTAVSVPDEVFEMAERLARRMKKSRSQLYSEAIGEYVARHAPDAVTERMNQVCEELGDGQDELAAQASARVLEGIEW
jgi:predicted transcriptional regulator